MKTRLLAAATVFLMLFGAAIAENSTREVEVGVKVEYRVSDATNAVNGAIEELLKELPDNLRDRTAQQETDLIETAKLYEALTDDEKLFVTQREAFETVLNAFGEINHQDETTGVKIANVDWNIRLIVVQQEMSPEFAEAMKGIFNENGEARSLYYIDLIDVLTGERFQTAEWFELELPAEGANGISYSIDSEGALTLNPGVSFKTGDSRCWYGVIEFAGEWADLLEGDALSGEIPENWLEWMIVPEEAQK